MFLTGVPQESLLDPEGLPIDGHTRLGRRASGTPSLLGSSTHAWMSVGLSPICQTLLTPFSPTAAKQEVMKSLIEVLPEMMQVNATRSHRIGAIWFWSPLNFSVLFFVLSSPLRCPPEAWNEEPV